jgi:hypothetical protein
MPSSARFHRGNGCPSGEDLTVATYAELGLPGQRCGVDVARDNEEARINIRRVAEGLGVDGQHLERRRRRGRIDDGRSPYVEGGGRIRGIYPDVAVTPDDELGTAVRRSRADIARDDEMARNRIRARAELCTFIVSDLIGVFALESRGRVFR